MKLYHIVGLRDVTEEAGEEFRKLAAEENPSEEILQIRDGYTNPFIVASIIRCKARCLDEKD